MAGIRESGGEGFVGDRELLARQMAERDNPQPEESYEDRMAREAYNNQRADAEEAMRSAEASIRRAEREHRRAEQEAAQSAFEHKGDSSNYYFVPEEGPSLRQTTAGKLYYTAPDGSTYLVQDNEKRYSTPVLIKNPPRRLTDEEELAAAIARSKRGPKASSQLPF